VPSNWLTHGDEDLYAWHDLTAKGCSRCACRPRLVDDADGRVGEAGLPIRGASDLTGANTFLVGTDT
jgi:hypothetical protein